MNNVSILNEWLNKASMMGTMPATPTAGAGIAPRPGLIWKASTHRWIRPHPSSYFKNLKQYVKNIGPEQATEEKQVINMRIYIGMKAANKVNEGKDYVDRLNDFFSEEHPPEETFNELMTIISDAESLVDKNLDRYAE